MATLRLDGILSYIDKYNRLKIVYIDDIDPSDKTREKLNNHCRSDRKPFDNDEFTVNLPKTMKKVTSAHGIDSDIKALIGRRVIVYVSLGTYSFTSPLEKNLGEKIKGVQLVLKSIEAHH
jgi:hypothetical protein